MKPSLPSIIPGWSHSQRVQGASPALIKSRAKPLNVFLARASQAVRAVFDGPVTYASLPPEHVDWDMFDLIGVNYYWSEPVKDRYLTMLEPLVASSKPVVVTEMGFRTDWRRPNRLGRTREHRPADHGTASVPLTRPFVRLRVKTIHGRSEELQAPSLTRQLELLDHAGVNGAFVYMFTPPRFPAQTTHDTTSIPTASAWSSPVSAGTAPPTRIWLGNPSKPSTLPPTSTPQATADFCAHDRWGRAGQGRRRRVGLHRRRIARTPEGAGCGAVARRDDTVVFCSILGTSETGPS